jgi:hypothetical protein
VEVMAQVDHYELIMKLIGYLEEARWKDEPRNALSFAWKEGHETAIDTCINEIRREL